MKNLLILILVLLLVFPIYTSALSCEVTDQACEGKNKAAILCLSDKTNAHAELPINGVCDNYNYALCCEDETYVSNECSGNYAVVAWLSEVTNSHASMQKTEVYDIPVCIAGLRETKCQVGGFDSAAHVTSFSAEENAHVAGPKSSSYDSHNIYCSLTSDGDQDGYSANEDCDDDNPAVHLDAEEIGDGLDNNCNGLMDGDDKEMKDFPAGWYQLSEAAGFEDYTPAGVRLTETENFQKAFELTEGKQKGIISKKNSIEPNKDYVASVNATCEITLQLAFDNNVASKEESGFWDWLIEPDQKNSATGTGRVSIIANSGEARSASILITAKKNGCRISLPQLELKGRIQPIDYNDVFQPFKLPIEESTSLTSSACCPENSCWTGFTCVENMRDNTFLFENVSGKAVYRCLDGQWVFRAVLYDWNNQEWGSCPEEGQCFILSSLKGGDQKATPEDFYKGVFPTCVNHSSYIFDHYCNNGSWTSRTKFLASKLLEVAADEDYALYCDDYSRTILSTDNQDTYLGGTSTTLQTQPQETGASLLGPAAEQSASLCFDSVKLSSEGQRLVPDTENKCINKVCVLKYKKSGKYKVAFATSLNKPVKDADSFLLALNVPQNKLDTTCSESAEGFIKCDLSGVYTEGGESQTLWYAPKLNLVVYDKEGTSLTPGIIDTALDWVKNLFGVSAEESSETDFLKDTDNFQRLYLLKVKERKIQALQYLSGEDLVLKAQFEQFSTPVCDYISHLKVPSELESELLEELSGMQKLNCTPADEKGTQSIEVIVSKDGTFGLDFLWPQLTGKLRVG